MPPSIDAKVRILYYVVFISLYTLAFSLPLSSRMQPLDMLHRRSFAIIHKNKTEKASNNPARTKWNQSSKTSHSTRIKDDSQNANFVSRNDTKRGLDIGLEIKLPTTPQTELTRGSNDLDKLEEFLKKVLEGQNEVLNTSACPKCDEEGEQYVAPERRRLKPAYECDEWDPKYRVCILERNLGDTVTFYLSTGTVNGHKLNVTWKKEFHMQDSDTRREFPISQDDSPENIIIGKQGYELRISPILEIDVGYNLFSALLTGHTSAQSKVYFMIRIVPIDLGFVYVGETIEINLRSYVSLPSESLSFKWYMEKIGERSTLPSNMRTSASGSSIRISELRQEQEGILACSVYTNLKFLATKKRFRMKDLVKNNDVLVMPPDHNLRFEEKRPERDKRLPKKSIKHKRDIDLDEIVEKALMESTTTKRHSTATTNHETTSHGEITHSYDDYNIGMDFENGEKTVRPGEDPLADLYDPGNRYVESDEEKHRYSLEEQQADGATENNNVNFDLRIKNIPPIENFQAQNSNDEPQVASIEHTSDTIRKVNSYDKPSNEISESENQQLNGHDIPVSRQPVFSGGNDFDVNLHNQKNYYGIPLEESEIILNVDSIPRPRKISAEEKIANLISSCYSDLECSGSAICTGNTAKEPGFCKCLPGFYGVGIFCREDIWIGKRNIGIEDM